MRLKSLMLIPVRILIVLCFVAAGMLFFTPVGGNLWFLFSEPSYFIPAESSVFTFRPVKFHSGPGDWWVYGADGNNFYHVTDPAAASYQVISRERARNIAGFRGTDAGTWK